MTAHRLLLTEEPYATTVLGGWYHRGEWPAHWIGPSTDRASEPGLFRCRLVIEGPYQGVVHLTADHRYELHVDGERVGRGPERGDEDNWAFESYRLELGEGTHEIRVDVLWFSLQGNLAAFAQHGIRPGLLFSPDDLSDAPKLATGVAPWTMEEVPGIEFKDPQQAWGTGANVKMTVGGESEPVPLTPEKLHPGRSKGFPSEQGRIHLLRSAILPPMRQEILPRPCVRFVGAWDGEETAKHPIRLADSLDTEEWTSLLEGQPLRVDRPLRVLLDFGEYVCARPIFKASGKGTVRVNWQESLFTGDGTIAKGNRDEIEGKLFATIWSWTDGIGDLFVFEGAGQTTTPWWQAGRYVEVCIQPGEGLSLEALQFESTGYPFAREDVFESSDPALEEIAEICHRTLRMCAHETYMDCPYYEQLQYVGDTRIQALVTYATTLDDRLPRQALRAFDVSRNTDGVTRSRYPSRVRQIIPPFSLWYVGLVWDFAMWRGDTTFIRSLLPGVRTVLDFFSRLVGDDDLMGNPPGWNYVDWVPTWDSGEAPAPRGEPNSILNLQYAMALRQAAGLEAWCGEAEIEALNNRRAESVGRAIREKFFVGRQFTTDLAHRHRSEHAQALAFLAGIASSEELDLDVQEDEATIMFLQYVFEAYGASGQGSRLLNRMDVWRWHLENGMSTTIEMPEPTRSDCHAWGAHPLYHFHATILGVRPAEFGFASVAIDPSPGGLDWVKGTMPHPLGPISVDWNRERCVVELPAGLSGVYRGRTPLKSGRNELLP
ncbi:alpha-L-rhamnosidase [bacterium]|nr:MAG: alpha-L-rhamnosidase [bacterium]